MCGSMKKLLPLTLLLLTGCWEQRAEPPVNPDPAPYVPPELHWALAWLDGITVEHIIRAGGLLCAALGVLCILGVVGAVILGNKKIAATLGAAGPMLMIAGGLLAWLGSNLWWIALIVGLVAAALGGYWVWVKGIPSLEKRLGIDINRDGVLGPAPIEQEGQGYE